MLQFGVLDVVMPTPTDIIIDSGLWMPLSLGVLAIIGLIVSFILNNRNKKMTNKHEEENREDNKEE